ncbi:YnbE family lipoprotein [Novosphingobium piscinae]|uniref:YnbE family lipoprotein n=2 Tax=Novosphingobium piscinae TaxID=1507448 RepID=A0A7X1KNT7_9SPHN|nr:YnbE family lipoprotein [Novosphingobium piscinae]
MQGDSKRGRFRGLTRMATAGMLVAGLLAMGGCISVNAPDKPIVIELNINIQQEVVYRLAKDADQTIAQNPEIF